MTSDPSFKQLPVSKHARQVFDRFPAEVVVTLIQPGHYSLAGTMTNEHVVGVTKTDDEELIRVFKSVSKEIGAGIPVYIRACPQTRFECVWRIVELAVTNGCHPVFETYVKSARLGLPIDFTTTSNRLAPTNTINLLIKQDWIQIRDRSLTMKQLEPMLGRLAEFDRSVVMSIEVEPKVSYQRVIDILGECSAVGLYDRVLGIRTIKEPHNNPAHATGNPAPDR